MANVHFFFKIFMKNILISKYWKAFKYNLIKLPTNMKNDVAKLFYAVYAVFVTQSCNKQHDMTFSPICTHLILCRVMALMIIIVMMTSTTIFDIISFHNNASGLLHPILVSHNDYLFSTFVVNHKECEIFLL